MTGERRKVAEGLAPGEARLFEARVNGELRPCFVVGLSDGGVAGFVNVCAHRNRPVLIDGGPDVADRDEATGLPVVECTAHGAVYDAATGECVSGPCVGAALTPVEIVVDGDEVFVIDDDVVDDSIYAME